jgi:hypothetical protein
MKYKVRERTTITREDGTLLGAGNLLENPTAFEIKSNRECLEVVPDFSASEAPGVSSSRKKKAKKAKELED